MNLNKKIFNVVFKCLLCLSITSCKGEVNSPVGNDSISKENNDKIIDSLKVDINSDEIQDIILVQETKEGGRKIIVKLRQASNYRIIDQNDIIIGCETCGYQSGDPYIDLTSNKDGFNLNLEYNSMYFKYKLGSIILESIDVTRVNQSVDGIDEKHIIITSKDFGKVKLNKVDNQFIANLVNKIKSIKTDEIIFPKKTSSNPTEGLYILKSCENSRFKIKLEKKESNYYYSVTDNAKTILKGKAILNEDEITMDKMRGVISNEKLTIQNYDNSTNEYIHFTQCEEKDLIFEKEAKK